MVEVFLTATEQLLLLRGRSLLCGHEVVAVIIKPLGEAQSLLGGECLNLLF